MINQGIRGLVIGSAGLMLAGCSLLTTPVGQGSPAVPSPVVTQVTMAPMSMPPQTAAAQTPPTATPAADTPPPATASPEPSADASGVPSASAAAQVIEMTLSDSMTITPSALTVKAGVPVTFKISNEGAIQHEFFVGDAAAQAKREHAMNAGTAKTDDTKRDVLVDPGSSKSLTMTFDEPGEIIVACHFPGHFAAGMKAIVTVEP